MALTHVFILGFGVLLIGIPILLHMLMQPKPKAHQFPALRFVRQMHRTNQRSLQLRHWLLMLLRCLLLLALAAAFARPSTTSNAFGNWLGLGAGVLLSLLVGLLFLYALVWSRPANIPLALVVGAVLALVLAWTGYAGMTAFSQNTKHVLADQQAPVSAALLVDSSPRMSYRSENQKLLQKVQDQGRWLISQLPLNSKIAVMETDGEKPFFSVDIGAARKRLNTMDINYAAMPIPDSLTQAVQFLAETESERKEVYVFTDLTRVSWLNSGEGLKTLLEDYPEVSLFVIDVGVEEPINFSLDQLQLAATSIPARGQLEIDTQIRSTGPGKMLLLTLNLEKPDPTRPVRRDGETLVPDKHWTRVTNVDVGDNSLTSAKIVLQDDVPEGIHHGWLEIEGGDSLPEDDRRYFTIEVRPAWPVLVVRPNGVTPDNLVDVLETAGGMFDVRVIEQRQLAGEPMSDYNAIVLLNPEPITDPLWRLLQAYVDGGGGLGIFLGHNAADGREPDLSFRTDAAAEVLPGRLVRDWRRRSGEDLLLSIDNLTHPIAKEFRPLASLGIWQPFQVHRHWEMNTGFDANVTVIARYTNGVPAVVERRIGAGKVICMTTPVTEPVRPDDRRAWNDLFNSSGGQEIWPAVLLIAEISDYLASGTRDRLNVGIGQTVTLQNDINMMPAEYRLFSPRDEEPLRIASSDSVLRYRFTDMPGAYRLKGQMGDETVLRGFSVNLPSESTDLQRLPEEELTEILGEERFQLARDRDEIERQQGTTRLGQEFYPILALMMSLFLALELIMSNRFYKKAAA